MQWIQSKQYYPFFLSDVGPHHLLKQSLVSTFWSTRQMPSCFHDQIYKMVFRHSIPTEDMLTNFLPDLRKYLLKSPASIVEEHWEFLSKIQVVLEKFLHQSELKFPHLWNSSSHMGKLAAHGLLLALRYVLFDK